MTSRIEGLARSTAGLGRELDTSRTSQTAWLTSPELAYDLAVQRIEDKIAEVTNVPKVSEPSYVMSVLPPEVLFIISVVLTI